MDISFWIATAGLPFLAVIVNAFTRWLCGLPQSAPADLVLFLVVFNGVVIIQAEDFKPFIHVENLRESLVAISVLLLVLDLVAWAISVFKIEHELEARYDHVARRFTRNPLVPIFSSMGVTLAAVILNLLPFTYRG